MHVLGFNGQLFAEQREPNLPKAESANVAKEASSVLDEKQVEAIVRRILAEQQRPEPPSSGASAERREPNAPKTETVSATKETSPILDEKKVEAIVRKILAEQPSPEPKPSDVRAFWKEGICFETRDKEFTMKIGGRIQNDWGWMQEDKNVRNHTKADGEKIGDLLDGTEFRSVRIDTSGTIYSNIDYRLQQKNWRTNPPYGVAGKPRYLAGGAKISG